MIDWKKNRIYAIGAFLARIIKTQDNYDYIPPPGYNYNIDFPNYSRSTINYSQSTIKKNISTTINNLSNGTRDCRDEDSREKFNYMLEQYQTIINKNSTLNPTKITIDQSVTVGDYKFPNLIIKLRGKTKKTIILGSHLDSRVCFLRLGRKCDSPGANDSASACAVNLECFRYLASLDNFFTYEFHLYTGKEFGLYGSKKMVNLYKKQKHIENIISYLNFDMVGWSKPLENNELDPRIVISSDYSDKDFNTFIYSLVEDYTDLEPVYDRLGYSSDHCSWYKANVPCTFVYESIFDYPYIHTAEDTSEKVSISRCYEFFKLGIHYFLKIDEYEKNKIFATNTPYS